MEIVRTRIAQTIHSSHDVHHSWRCVLVAGQIFYTRVDVVDVVGSVTEQVSGDANADGTRLLRD